MQMNPTRVRPILGYLSYYYISNSSYLDPLLSLQVKDVPQCKYSNHAIKCNHQKNIKSYSTFCIIIAYILMFITNALYQAL